MRETQQSAKIERNRKTIIYHRADCVEHDEKQTEQGIHMTDHFASRSVFVGGDMADLSEQLQSLAPDTCSCGASIISDTRVFEWPPVPITTRAVLDLLRRSDGHIALEVEPLTYPEEHVDWQSVIGVDDPIRDEQWAVGLIGSRLVTRTATSYQPIWSATELTHDQLGTMLRKLPAVPKPISNTPLSGVVEDYHNGHALTTGVAVDEN